MPEGFHSFSYHSNASPLPDVAAAALRGTREIRFGIEERRTSFTNDEAAARAHLSRLLGDDHRPAVRGVTAPDRAELVPDLRLVSTRDVPQTSTRVLSFEQTHASIPVFGSNATAELNADRDLVSAGGEIADLDDVSPVATLSPADALAGIAKLTGTDPGALEPKPDAPELVFFRHPGTGTWHLAYHFTKVAVAPADLLDDRPGHGLGRSPRDLHPLVDYLVDGHDGEVVYYYSSTPLLTVPTELKGTDEDGASDSFWGQMQATEFVLSDPLRNIATYDLTLGDIADPKIGDPVRNDAADLGTVNRAAVSAHVNSGRVFDFYKSVLLRDGIDDRGMTLVNVVNCTYSQDEAPPRWGNAVWYDGRMWYGQTPGEDDRLVSFSRFLDVMAHELTHGVTEHTAKLVYRDQSGALNESFSDIFGMIIKNWDATRPEDGGDVATWDWKLGSGLGPDGGPLRDLSDPTTTGDPADMAHYVQTTRDSGGVHTNSNIHNKAAYNVLTATDAAGARAFTPKEAAVLYYLALTRLSAMATFSEALRSLITVAQTYFGGDPAVMQAKVDAIRGAYGAVGISEE